MAESIFERVKLYTMLDEERINAIVQQAERIVAEKIPGDFVECGVWCGGAPMAIALTALKQHNQRPLHLFDTFEGMPTPEAVDTDYMGRSALAGEGYDASGCIARQPQVEAALLSTEYPRRLIITVKGKVEDTLPWCQHRHKDFRFLCLDCFNHREDRGW